VAAGESTDEVVSAAGKLGYAEPGAVGVFDVIHNEAMHDVPRKTAIVLQTIFPEMVGLDLVAKMETELSEDDVLDALNEADRYRYLVSVFPEYAADQAGRMNEGRLGGFHFEQGGWLVTGGFQRTDRTNALSRFNGIAGAGAGYYVNLGPKDKSTIDGENFVVGTGAGGAVTANAMLDNYQALRQTA
jgi:homoserine dehydrogenase